MAFTRKDLDRAMTGNRLALDTVYPAITAAEALVIGRTLDARLIANSALPTRSGWTKSLYDMCVSAPTGWAIDAGNTLDLDVINYQYGTQSVRGTIGSGKTQATVSYSPASALDLRSGSVQILYYLPTDVTSAWMYIWSSNPTSYSALISLDNRAGWHDTGDLSVWIFGIPVGFKPEAVSKLSFNIQGAEGASISINRVVSYKPPSVPKASVLWTFDSWSSDQAGVMLNTFDAYGWKGIWGVSKLRTSHATAGDPAYVSYGTEEQARAAIANGHGIANYINPGAGLPADGAAQVALAVANREYLRQNGMSNIAENIIIIPGGGAKLNQTGMDGMLAAGFQIITQGRCGAQYINYSKEGYSPCPPADLRTFCRGHFGAYPGDQSIIYNASVSGDHYTAVPAVDNAITYGLLDVYGNHGVGDANEPTLSEWNMLCAYIRSKELAGLLTVLRPEDVIPATR